MQRNIGITAAASKGRVNMTCTRTRSYYDRAPSMNDRSNTIFYIYSIGPYNNTPIYFYGETNDVMAKEFSIKRNLPYYRRIVAIPVCDAPYGYSQFDKYIYANKLNTSLSWYRDDDQDMFALDHVHPFTEDDIVNYVNSLFLTKST